ncbi:MAG TPA: phenylalanine--tRNA ligase subunit beta, partial [Chitinophagaceae bacterium]
MRISYNWLCDYLPAGQTGLPVKIEPRQLGEILTAIGLEVESLEKSEEVKGSLEGLVIGEVLDVAPHPNADKLKLTFVNTGGREPLKIVCGAPNVAPGQKVIVAGIGVTIYPVNREPVTMKLAKIRGEESFGMICAEDEIGLGSSHNGILVLPENAGVGLPAKEYFRPAEDWVFEIGLTPNRMDAMSHIGVAKDVCAYLSNLENKNYQVCIPSVDTFRTDNHDLPITVVVENLKACPRYSGVSISGIRIRESPAWLQQKLKAIGSRPVNNIVDITNFVLHECGQPLHAFDAAKIKGR